MAEEEMTDSMREAMSLNGDPERLAAFYDKWATNYDVDVGSENYGVPASMVVTLSSAVDVLAEQGVDTSAFASDSATVLDVGCGTGQIGVALSKAGYQTIDGIDISAEMIAIATSTGAYRQLEAGVDLTGSIPSHLRHRAEIVVIGGVFTVGHLPPTTLETIATMVKPGGLLVVSTRQAYQDQTGYQSVSEELEKQGVLRLVCPLPNRPYTMDSVGDYWAYQVRI